MEVKELELIYLYCVTDKESQPKMVENLVDKFYFIDHLGLYAVVSKVKESEFSESNLKKNLADFEWVKKRASIHEEVIEEVMKRSCVIPFKFGTIFNSEDNLKVMLDEHAQEVKTNLENLKGKKEWGIKIYCDIEKLKRSLFQEDGEFLKVDKQISSSAPGKAFLLEKKKEQLLKDTLNKRINECGQKSFEILKCMSSEARINKLLPKEVTERKDDMILNSAFLLKKCKVPDFLCTVEGLKAKYNDEGFNFDCTGPWPPYNFCK